MIDKIGKSRFKNIFDNGKIVDYLDSKYLNVLIDDHFSKKKK